MSNHSLTGFALVFGLLLAVAPGLHAQTEVDLSSSVTLPDTIVLGQPFTVTVGYANAGPGTHSNAFMHGEFIPPMGLDVFLDDYWNNDAAMYQELRDSATDSLGNFPRLFWEDFHCEEAFFELQGEESPSPILPLASGESGSFSFQTMFPMESPRGGNVEITAPSSIAKVWTLTDPANFWIGKGYATTYSAFATTTCAKNVGEEEEDICGYIPDNCWGTKVSHLPEPIEAEFVLVDDGSGTPTYGCDEYINAADVAGKIAVVERGTCEFGEKGFLAEQAGALGVFMVNSLLCSPPDYPDSDQCTINMGPGLLGGLVSIPMVMVSRADGQPVLDALNAKSTVTGVFGSSSQFAVKGWALQSVDGDEEDSDDDNDVSVSKAPISTASEPPTASFTYSPSSPAVGSPVTFTDTSTGGPTSWAWDFGDGGSSTDQNPTYTYTTGGTFTVTLTATNGAGSSMASMDVMVSLGASLDEAYFIAAAALASGAEGSFFQTDVDINNGGSADADYAFAWLPRGTNNSSPTMSDTLTLAGGASIRYENVLSAVFGAEPNVSGSLAVFSNSTELNIMSRTYNLPTAKASGTFGQAIPGIPADELIGQNDTRRIIFMSENDDLRANLGCVNGVNDNLPIDITTYDETGAVLETQRMNLSPWSNNQINQIFADFAPTNGYADVTSIKATAGFYCYGSVLDNGSNDPTTILPTEYSSGSGMVNYFIPAAALAAGAEGSFFQTDVDINNAGSTMATYSFLWLPRGQNNSSPTTSASFTLAAGASVRYENVLSEVFGATPDVSGALAISADTPDLGVMSRTYNVPTAKVSGTFGQAIPGIPQDMLIGQNEVKRIIFMSENDDLRANLGCVNGVNDNLPIDITTYDETGAMLETQRMNLSPWSNNQINQIFSDFAPTNGYAEVSSIKATAGFYCYGSVLDNGSNDPTTILPQ